MHLSQARKRIIVLFAGTRPEAVKLAMLVLAARAFSELEVHLVHSGQHDTLFRDGLQPFGLTADHLLSINIETSHPETLADAIHLALLPVLMELRPDLVVVQGDTSSAVAGARAAEALQIPLAHVEAGLRSGDPSLPYPEEGNRIMIGKLADYHFAPCAGAALNLANEAVRGQVYVTGNPGIDALLHVRARITPKLGAPSGGHILVTAHRREIVGAPLARVIDALRMLVDWRFGLQITIICHTNPAGRQFRDALAGVAGFNLLDGVPYSEMVSLLSSVDLVLSDSGGLQEECPALGTPLLILRDNTERPEAVACGSARLVGTGTRKIFDETVRILTDPAVHKQMAEPRFPYGTGDASRRIMEVIATLPLGID